MTRRTVAFIHLGCAKNLVDAEIMGGHLEAGGWDVSDEVAKADVVIINTCGFIQEAKEESLSEIFAFLEDQTKRPAHDQQGLVVAGCLTQRYQKALHQEIPEIDGLLGVNDLDEVTRVVDAVLRGNQVVAVSQEAPSDCTPARRRRRQTPEHYAYVKIAEGCSRGCGYCAIPLIRGPFRSQDPTVIFDEVQTLVSQGVREINLIAQDVTRYGADLDGWSFELLLERLARAFSDTWFRCLYAYPSGVSRQLVRVLAKYDNVCPYLDLPLQHVSPSILTRMGRNEDPKKVRALLGHLRREVPNMSIRSTFMVGFPGETEADFEQLIRFLQEEPLDHVGVFAYSREEGTPAYSLSDPIPETIKRERQRRLQKVAMEVALIAKRPLVGQTLPVLLDQRSDEGWLGRHQGQAPEVDGNVLVADVGAKSVGDRVFVRITGVDAWDLWGRACRPTESNREDTLGA